DGDLVGEPRLSDRQLEDGEAGSGSAGRAFGKDDEQGRRLVADRVVEPDGAGIESAAGGGEVERHRRDERGIARRGAADPLAQRLAVGEQPAALREQLVETPGV